MLPSNASVSGLGCCSCSVACRDNGDSARWPSRPVDKDCTTISPATPSASSRNRRRRSAISSALMSRPSGAPADAASAPGASSVGSRSSTLRTPWPSRRMLARTPRALMRSMTSRPRNSGHTCTASAASWALRNSSSRPRSDSRRPETCTASRGKIDSLTGPSMTSVRWCFVCIHSAAKAFWPSASKVASSTAPAATSNSSSPTTAKMTRRQRTTASGGCAFSRTSPACRSPRPAGRCRSHGQPYRSLRQRSASTVCGPPRCRALSPLNDIAGSTVILSEVAAGSLCRQGIVRILH
jgi:hypothetical protein